MLLCVLLQGDPMRIVYRMRGLLGDATEDMVNSLDSGKGEYSYCLGLSSRLMESLSHYGVSAAWEVHMEVIEGR